MSKKMDELESKIAEHLTHIKLLLTVTIPELEDKAKAKKKCEEIIEELQSISQWLSS